jgi:hypothetical protein
MSKKEYTQLNLSGYRKLAKEAGAALTEDMMLEWNNKLSELWLRQVLVKRSGGSVDEGVMRQVGIDKSSTMLLGAAMNRRVRHYFLAPGLASFLVGCVKDTVPEYLHTFPTLPPVKTPQGRSQLPVFVVNFPVGESFDRSLVVGANLHTVVVDDESRTGTLPLVLADGVDVLWTSSAGVFDMEADEGAQRKLRLAYGLSLYLDAFPDVVRTALADDYAHPAHYKGDCRMVRQNDYARVECRHAGVAHWRAGHFRVLRSDRFTHKQWQTIPIQGCFVKGIPVEVSDN